jgi:hypothetical protein
MAYHNAHAARIVDNIVREVIVIPRQKDDRDDLITQYCNSIGIPGTWIDTSYVGARRGIYAGIGYTYDPELDIFIAPETAEIEEV